MAPNTNNQYGKIVSTVLHVKEHKDSQASILEDLELTDANLEELIEKDNKREHTRGDE